MKKYIVGLDIGGTKCAAVIAEDGELPLILEKIQFPIANLSPNQVLQKFADFIHKSNKIYPVSGIGISCGGPLDSTKGIIMSPPSLPLWNHIEIVKFFEERFNIPTKLQNDANACAVAEWKFGAGKGSKNMIFLTFGTGLGGGLILNGKLYSGENDNAGEIGHVRLTQSGPLGYYKKGSCEGYCSGGGIARLAILMLQKEKYKKISQPLLNKVGGEKYITAKDIAQLAIQKDPFCVAVYKKSGEMLGRTLSILVDVLNPEKIIIGGVFMRSENLLLPYCKKVMQKECLSYSLQAVKILPAKLEEKVGDYAALAIAKGEY